jgi:hypothetical protein
MITRAPSLIGAVAVALLICGRVGTIAAQQPTVVPQTQPDSGGKCILDFKAAQGDAPPHLLLNKLPSGKSNAFLGGGIIGTCRGQDVTLKADSAEYYGDQNLLYLIGHVHYIETRAKIDADRMTYWTVEGHLHAEGNVYAVTSKGATMRGPQAEYYRKLAGVRDVPMLVANGRPQLDFPQRDSVTGEVKDTIHLVADRVTSINDSLVYAGGKVNITRPEFLATSDSAYLDNGIGRAQLLINPSVKAQHQQRPFTLTGGMIDVFSTNKQVSRIVATPDGHATSNDLQLYADSIDMRVEGNTLNRAYAWGKTRARAISPEHDIIADSIEAILPNQRIEELHAVHNAYATSIPDTTAITTAERDWMRGDTIVALFDTTQNTTTPTTADTNATKTPPIKTLLARVNAKAYYHLKNSDGIKNKPSVNYVRGQEIDIAFENREVQTVTVQGQASGVYIEPQTDSTRASKIRPGAPGSTSNHPPLLRQTSRRRVP